MAEQVNPKSDSPGTQIHPKKWVECFSTYLFFLAIFDDISMLRSTFHFEKSSNMAKNGKKSLVQLAFKPFLHSNTGTRNLNFGYPFRHLQISNEKFIIKSGLTFERIVKTIYLILYEIC